MNNLPFCLLLSSLTHTCRENRYLHRSAKSCLDLFELCNFIYWITYNISRTMLLSTLCANPKICLHHENHRNQKTTRTWEHENQRTERTIGTTHNHNNQTVTAKTEEPGTRTTRTGESENQGSLRTTSTTRTREKREPENHENQKTTKTRELQGQGEPRDPLEAEVNENQRKTSE